VPTPIAGEHPLTLYVDKREIVTLMTLGQAPEALAIGYLRNQRLVKSIDEIAAVQVDWETASVAITTSAPIEGLEKKMEKRTVTTGCGQGTVFGDLMEEVDSIKLREDVTLTEDALHALLDAVRRHEAIYKEAGAVHGCALVENSASDSAVGPKISTSSRTSDGTMRWMRSRAKCGSTAWTARTRSSNTTGRLTSEMVIKAAQMQIPFLVSRSGLTKMGHEIAAKLGVTMIGRAAGGKHYLLFTGKHRFRKTVAPTLMA